MGTGRKTFASELKEFVVKEGEPGQTPSRRARFDHLTPTARLRRILSLYESRRFGFQILPRSLQKNLTLYQQLALMRRDRHIRRALVYMRRHARCGGYRKIILLGSDHVVA